MRVPELLEESLQMLEDKQKERAARPRLNTGGGGGVKKINNQPRMCSH